jgi:hypothetical protein
VIFALPSNPVAVPTTPVLRAIVLLVSKEVADDALPVTFPTFKVSVFGLY